MTLTRASLIFLAATIFSCSDKESEEPWGQTGTVQGQVTLANEFGVKEGDQSGAVVTFQSGSSSQAVTAESDGRFVASDIPMGTYDIQVSKPGYVTTTTSGYRLIGGENPRYTLLSTIRPSTTKVTDVTVAIAENNLSITGTMIHNNSYPSPWAYVAVFVGKTPDVSPTTYDQANPLYVNGSSGSTFNTMFFLDHYKFPKGSTAYVVVYGATNATPYDLVTGRYIYYGVGTTPSNVVSIVIP